MPGPLTGLKVVEILGLGACPFAAMMLADMGAEVIRVDRPGGGEIMGAVGPEFDVMSRSRDSIVVDLKKPGASEVVLRLVQQADILLEGFRPGVMERLGLGPEDCWQINPRLIFGRMTGWGQTGPLSQAAGHDNNYLALSGVLHALGKEGQAPIPPMNLLGDFGGGGMLLAFGVMCAYFETLQSGKGQVVDAAMVDGSALLASMIWGLRGAGQWRDERGANVNDGGAHFYNTYECADGKYVCIASAEARFYARFLEITGLKDPAFEEQNNPQRWPELKQKVAEVFIRKTRAEWCELMEGTDVCFSPVLDWNEAPQHPHNQARETFTSVAGVMQPSPAPRFSRTPPAQPTAPTAPGANTHRVLNDWGFNDAEVSAIKQTGIIV